MSKMARDTPSYFLSFIFWSFFLEPCFGRLDLIEGH